MDSGQTTRWWTRLSGRGRWVLLAGVIGALAGAAAGWWGFGEMTYQSQGHVRLGSAHKLTGLTSEGVDTLIAPGTLRVDEVIERELAELRQLSGPAESPQGLTIAVKRSPESPTRLDLSAIAEEPDVAIDAVRSILAAYQSTTALDKDAARAEALDVALAKLSERRTQAASARTRLADAQAAMRTGAGQASSSTLPLTADDPEWSNAVWAQTQAQRTSERLRQMDQDLEPLPVPNIEQVAALDPEAAVWWGRVRGLNQQLAKAVWPPNPAMASRIQERISLETKLQARARDTRIVTIGGTGAAFRAVRVSQTRELLEQALEAEQAADARVAQLEPRLAVWQKLQAEVTHAEQMLAEQEAAVGQLDLGTGVRLIEAGLTSQDAMVWRDTRPWTALIAGMAGALVGVFGTGLMFMLDNRVRRSRDGGLVGSAVPVLGAVPTTDESSAADTEPGEQPIEVASIQSVRAVLESKMRPASDGQLPGGAFAVTGIAAGSGATSVAVGLAVSMALSGSRVLLIDLAWLQKPAGSGTDEDAARQGLGVDGVIEALGYLDDEDREALALGDDREVGFGAILTGVSLRRSVVQTRVPGLSVLSAMGQAKTLRKEWTGRVSSRWLSKLMEVARRGGYTATILDAGSATGSVEGMLGCAAADGTVVVVSGGQSQADYDKAVTRLKLVGATILGTVLNRSDAKRLDSKGNARVIGRAAAPGSTTGSGIFAAAIEARAGGRTADGGSGMFAAPLPRVEDAPPTQDLAADQTTTATAQDLPPQQKTPELPPSNTGVDPFAEPPAEVRPTPVRQPPARANRDASVPEKRAPEELLAEAFSTEPGDAAPSTEGNTAPSDNPNPDIHVADDVMDQLVDHAIRSAQRPRKPQSTPPADSSS
ncbi:MAG: hypothetical protein AAGA25_07975 [Planctomycetota bacterium]